jgi:2-polyprenyl-6-methoxyphenol hydroxylase-like FAD-dependent oxidoreductase
MPQRKALIIGGGIGGVTAASALLRAGLDVVVYEQAKELHEVGAGLTIWPNAMKALRLLGSDEAVWAIGRPFGVGRIYDWRGRVLVEGAQRAVLQRRFGWPGTVLHRHRLLALLAQPLPPAVLRLGARCTDFRQDGSGVTVRFADGSEDRGDLLVGADGLNSLVRAGLLGPRPPRYNGYTAYRGITQFPLEGDTASEAWGCGQRFGFVPGPGREIYWWAAVSVPEGLNPSPHTYKPDLLVRYRNWFEPITAVIDATPEGAILRNDVYDRPPTRRCSLGRVTLLGDAAHPITPDLGQGACLAIEDAVVLARCLACEKDTAGALRAYDAARIGRARFLTRHSHWMGRLGQLRHPWLCRSRNALVRATPTEASLLWLSWHFRFEA